MPVEPVFAVCSYPLRRWRGVVRGFTLVELVMVVVLLGVLSVYAAPRVFNMSYFYTRGFHDETLAYLRFAQKTAMAQRRTVCVAFTTSSLTLTIASEAGTYNCDTSVNFVGPKGESPVTLSAGDSSAVYTITPTAFNFDGQGQPISSAGVAVTLPAFQVSGSGKTISVEATTGYVHE